MSRPWMPFYVADYIKDTRQLTTLQHGAYLLLIMEYWTKGSLPDDSIKLARIVGMSAAEWKKTRPILQPFFHDGWNHKRLDKELAKFSEKQTRRQEAGKRGGIASANGKQRAKQNPSNAQASSSQPQSDSDAYASETRARESDWPNDYRETFWQLYPHKIGKKTALEKLDRVRKRGDVLWPHLISALKRYVAAKPIDQAWCNPETWINQGRWDDQPALPLAGSHHGKNHDTVVASAARDVERIQGEIAAIEEEGTANQPQYPVHIQRLPRGSI